MKILFSLIFTLVFNGLIFGQDCYCPVDSDFMQMPNQKPDKIYTFSNGEKLAICGGSDTENNEKVWSEFTISRCGADTALLEFDAIQNCTVEQNKDTLIVQEYYPIANGKNMSLQWTKFRITKVYWKSNQWAAVSYFRKDFKKYSKNEIEKAIEEYDTIKNENDFDRILLIGHKLFWAYVSGSEGAGQDLKNLEQKFGGTLGFDGAIKEDYDDLIATYELYKDETQTNKK